MRLWQLTKALVVLADRIAPDIERHPERGFEQARIE